MQRKSCPKMMAGLVLVLLSVGNSALAASATQGSNDPPVTFTVLYNFGGKNGDPVYPGGVVAQGRDGNLYTATSSGGALGDGVVFRITPAGAPTVLYDLKSYNGSSGLTLGTDGDFYGATVYGGTGQGYGTVFRVSPSGKMKVLYDFTGQNDDAYPHAPPIQAIDGNFYGTGAGDFYGNGGEVYKMIPSGSKISLFHFTRRRRRGSSRSLGSSHGRKFLRHHKFRGHLRQLRTVRLRGCI